jgi:membrane associated rhomboid family serine protease
MQPQPGRKPAPRPATSKPTPRRPAHKPRPQPLEYTPPLTVPIPASPQPAPAAQQPQPHGRDADRAVVQSLARASRAHARFTYAIIAVVAVTTLVQAFVGVERSIRLAAVDPAAIQRGEWLRLLTGTYLHGGLYHLVGNMLALWTFGAVMESRASRAQLPLVYLLSGLGGSLASALIPPDTPSIGASGAVVGVLGYLYVFSRRQQFLFPAAFRRATASAFTGLAVAGALGFWFIDNAGHAGGAITGIFLAGLIVDHAEMREPEVSRPLLDLLGWVAMAVIAAGAVITIDVMTSGGLRLDTLRAMTEPRESFR